MDGDGGDYRLTWAEDPQLQKSAGDVGADTCPKEKKGGYPWSLPAGVSAPGSPGQRKRQRQPQSSALAPPRPAPRAPRRSSAIAFPPGRACPAADRGRGAQVVSFCAPACSPRRAPPGKSASLVSGSSTCFTRGQHIYYFAGVSKESIYAM